MFDSSRLTTPALRNEAARLEAMYRRNHPDLTDREARDLALASLGRTLDRPEDAQDAPAVQTVQDTEDSPRAVLTVDAALTASETLEALAAVVVQVLEAKVSTLVTASLHTLPSDFTDAALQDLRDACSWHVYGEFRHAVTDAVQAQAAE